MAGLGGKNWTFQEEVTSSDVNGYLADQVVMRFADEATRTAGFGGAGEPTLAEGMVSYLDDQNRVDVYTGAAWKPVSQVLQVVSTTKTDTYTHSTGRTFSSVTGLTATITPFSASSKILVIVQVSISGNNGASWMKLTGGNASSYVGDTAGSRIRLATSQLPAATQVMTNVVMNYLDSPATTSATTYGVDIAAQDNTTTTYINRSPTDTDNNTFARAASTITVMEIAG